MLFGHDSFDFSQLTLATEGMDNDFSGDKVKIYEYCKTSNHFSTGWAKAVGAGEDGKEIHHTLPSAPSSLWIPAGYAVRFTDSNGETHWLDNALHHKEGEYGRGPSLGTGYDTELGRVIDCVRQHPEGGLLSTKDIWVSHAVIGKCSDVGRDGEGVNLESPVAIAAMCGDCVKGLVENDVGECLSCAEVPGYVEGDDGACVEVSLDSGEEGINWLVVGGGGAVVVAVIAAMLLVPTTATV